MKEKWTAGKPGGCVVSDTLNRHGTTDDHVEYYGGFLIAESIPAQKYVNLIAAALDLLEACEAALAYFEQCVMSCDPDDEDVAEASMLRAAIVKATGGAS